MLVAGFAVAAALTAAVPTSPACIETVHEAAVVVDDVLDREPVPSSEWRWEIRCGDSGSADWGETISTGIVRLWPAMAPTQDGLEDLVWHELGHMWAYELEDVERVRWMVERGHEWDDDWAAWHRPCESAGRPECYGTGSEDWAEAFSHCRAHRDPDRHWDKYGPVPTGDECALMDILLRPSSVSAAP